jgi:hypothetical protein
LEYIFSGYSDIPSQITTIHVPISLSLSLFGMEPFHSHDTALGKSPQSMEVAGGIIELNDGFPLATYLIPERYPKW